MYVAVALQRDVLNYRLARQRLQGFTGQREGVGIADGGGSRALVWAFAELSNKPKKSTVQTRLSIGHLHGRPLAAGDE